MKTFFKNVLSIIGAAFVLITAGVGVFAYVAPDAWAQVAPRRPIFGPYTQVTDLTVDEQANIYELTVGVGGCTNCGGGTPGGMDTQVQYNNAGAFGGIPLTWDAMTETLTLTGAMDTVELVDGSVNANFIGTNILSVSGDPTFVLQDFADDTAACMGGLDVGNLYQNSGAVRIVVMC